MAIEKPVEQTGVGPAVSSDAAAWRQMIAMEDGGRTFAESRTSEVDDALIEEILAGGLESDDSAFTGEETQVAGGGKGGNLVLGAWKAIAGSKGPKEDIHIPHKTTPAIVVTDESGTVIRHDPTVPPEEPVDVNQVLEPDMAVPPPSGPVPPSHSKKKKRKQKPRSAAHVAPEKGPMAWNDPDKMTEAERRDAASRGARFLHETDLDEIDQGKNIVIAQHTWGTHGEAWNVNAVLADHYEDWINTVKGGDKDGILRDEQLQKLADELSVDKKFVRKFLNRRNREGVNAEQILAARKILETSAERLKDLAYKVSNEETATARDHVEFLNQWDFHRQWMAQFAGARAELGRGMRALRGDMGVQREIGAPPTVQQQRMEELLNTYSNLGDLRRLADQVLVTQDLTGLNKMVQGQSTGMNKWGAAFVENFVGSVLSGTKTIVVNTLGNVLMTAKGPVELQLAAMLGRGVQNPDEKVLMGEAMAMLFGQMSALWDGAVAAGRSFKTGDAYGDIARFEIDRNKAISSQALGINGPMGHLVDAYGFVARAPMERIMGPMDAFFKVLNERGYLAHHAYRFAMRDKAKENLTKAQTLQRMTEYMENPSFEMKQGAQEQGRYVTFQSDLQTMKGIQSSINHHWWMKMVMPFVRTPTNMLKVAFVESNPLMLLRKKYRDEMFPEPIGVDEHGHNLFKPGAQEAAQMARARYGLGASMMGLFSIMAAEGKITGSGPKDKASRDALYATGWRPRSILFRDDEGNITGAIEYNRIEPFALMMGTIADLADAYKLYHYQDLDQTTADKLAQVGSALTLAIAENSINKTYMMGLSEALNVVTQKDARYTEHYMANMMNAIVPLSGARRDIRKLTDEFMRETDGLMGVLLNTIPGFTSDGPLKYDIWGNPLKYERILNPLSFTKIEQDSIDVEIQRLMETTHQAPVTKPDKNYEGVIEYTPEQYSDLVKMGRTQILRGDDGRTYIPGREIPPGVTTYAFKEQVGIAIDAMRDRGATDFKIVEKVREIQTIYDKAARKIIHNQSEHSADIQEKMLKLKINNKRRLHGDDAVRNKLREQGKEVTF